MSKSLLVLFICHLLLLQVDGSSQVYNYNVTVKTSGSPAFESHRGKIKLNIVQKTEIGTSQEDFVLTPKEVKIESNREYHSTIASFAPLVNVSSVYLRWTLASPYNPIYKLKKPVIYYDSVTLIQINSSGGSHMIITQSRRYCPPNLPIGIKHGEGHTFYPCV